MAVIRPSAGFALVAAVIAALALSGCGRKGPLGLPPSDTPAPTASAAPNTAQNANPANSPMPSSGLFGQSSQPRPGQPVPGQPPTAYDAAGRPTTTTPQFKSFPLDPLLQ